MLANQSAHNEYPGTGAVSTYDFTFRIDSLAHLRVAAIDTAGTEHVLTAGIDFSVLPSAIGAANGGSITLLTGPLASGWTITLDRQAPPAQGFHLTTTGGLFPQNTENALDYLMQLVQQLMTTLGQRGELAATKAYVGSVVGTPAVVFGGRYALAARPVASAALHGLIVLVDDAGFPSEFHACARNADDTYGWISLGAGGL